MNKKILVLILLISFSTQVFSKKIEIDQLNQYAVTAFQQRTNVQSITIKSMEYLSIANDTAIAIYNFDEGGFIIMSADDAATPVLGYSFEGALEFAQSAPATQEVINSYLTAIQEMRSNRSSADSDIKAAWDRLKSNAKDVTSIVVQPLIKAIWNQNKYYNQYSPIDPESPAGYDNRVPNGCVAVAMAMIIYYHRYPVTGSGSHTNYSSYGNYSVNFAQQTYRYNAMQDQLESYNNEVAKLIFHCATSVDMSYSPEGSGAYSEDVPQALETYFNYSDDISYSSRNNSSGTQWRTLLKNNLDAGYPLYYSGYSQEGGHAFVCDGYDSDDLFHFNFGWGGSGNGYFVVDRVASAVNGYGSGQRIVQSIYPPEPYPYYCGETEILTYTNGTLEDGSSTEDYQNNSSCMYIIAPEDAVSFNIQIQTLQTEAGNDTLTFWNRHPMNNQRIASYSGEVTNESLTITTDSLYITFNTNSTITDAGWRLQYSVNRDVEHCSSLSALTEHSGTFGDDSGNSNYASSAECIWVIQPEGGADYITITFDEFDLSPEDFVTIYNTSTYPATILEVLTGSNIPAPVTSESHRVKVVFNSDNYLQRNGFIARWFTNHTDIQTTSANQFSIYPNPASDKIKIAVPNDLTDPVAIKIYNITGELVMTTTSQIMAGQDIAVSINHLASGFYTVAIYNNQEVITKKLVIQR